jgi:hypothetical protein
MVNAATQTQNIFSVEIYCPCFTGYYETLLSSIPDSYVEQEISCYTDGVTYKIKQEVMDYITNNLWDYVNYKPLFEDMSKKVVEYYNDNLAYYFGNDCSIGFEYQSLYSPKEYNFTSDSINIKVNFDDRFINVLKEYINENINEFEEYIKNRYTSCSGFISFYSNNYKDWIDYINNEDLQNNEHYMGCFLDFVVKNETSDITEDIYFHCYEHYNSNGYIDSFVEWDKFYSKVQELFNFELKAL